MTEQLQKTDDRMERWQKYKASAIAADIEEALGRVSDQVVGRERLVTQTLFALMCKEHQLVFSRAGIAKSLYANAVFSQFGDANMFRMQLTKYTPEEALVGGLSIEELKQGNYTHMTQDTIVDSEFAFLDELFDGNDNALRALLGILNEREFIKGKQVVRSSLHTAIATSNYLRANDVTEAVLDRFMFKATLGPEANSYAKLRIDSTYEHTGGTLVEVPDDEKISFDELDYVANVVQGKVPGTEIRAPYHVLFLKNAVIEQYLETINQVKEAEEAKPLYISPRTMAKARKVLNSMALLNGRSKVSRSDVSALQYLVCTLGNAAEAEAFDSAYRAVNRAITRPNLVAVDQFMEAHEIYEDLLRKLRDGETATPNTIERAKIFFGLGSLDELTFTRVEDKVKLVPDAMIDPRVVELKKGLLERVSQDRARYKGTVGDRRILI